MAAELSVGMKGMRRFKGGVWAEGFVTALEPTLLITLSSDDPSGRSRQWDEVQLVSGAMQPEPSVSTP